MALHIFSSGEANVSSKQKKLPAFFLFILNTEGYTFLDILETQNIIKNAAMRTSVLGSYKRLVIPVVPDPVGFAGSAARGTRPCEVFLLITIF